MRRFAFDDLTVNVAGIGGAGYCLPWQPSCAVVCSDIAYGVSRPITITFCQQITNPCQWLTDRTGCPAFSIPPTGCGLNYSTCPSPSPGTLVDHITQVINPEVLVDLRSQLEGAMAVLDERAGQLKQQFGPQTLDEAAAVEERLTSALKEVRALKKTLKG